MRHIHHWLMVLKVSSTHFSFHRTWVYTPTLTREDSNVSYFKRALICSISRNIEEEQISKKEYGLKKMNLLQILASRSTLARTLSAVVTGLAFNKLCTVPERTIY